MRGETRFSLLAVGGNSRPPPLADPASAEAWWRAASGGHWQPRSVPLPPVTLAKDPARWCAAGGLRPGPRGASALAQTALAALPPGTDCPEAVVLVVAGPIAPHAWRVAAGGVPVTPGRWVRRYAALPAGAELGVWAHELAHLLLGWPDLPGSPCLMGTGAARDGGREPEPPGPALTLAAGWLELLPLEPALPAAALGPGQAMAISWAGRALLVTDAARPSPFMTVTDLDRRWPPA